MTRPDGGRYHTIDIVVPLYNESKSCRQFHQALMSILSDLPNHTRVIYVDDGSTDNTVEILRQLDPDGKNIVVLQLSRNFGHQAALTAGLDFADADLIIMMDGDGQHPPIFIVEMLKLHRAGFDIVQMQRVDPPRSISPLKRLTSNAFYAVLNRLGETDIGVGVADFRLVSRDVLIALRQMHEYHRFIRGMVPWVGFKRVLLPFEAPRRMDGKTKFTLRKMLRLATDGLFSFSLFPLRLGLVLGLLLLIAAVVEITYVGAFFFSGHANQLVPGWSSLMIMLTISSGTTMILLGFIGIYIGMIFQQVKGRPVYVLRRSTTDMPEQAETSINRQEDHAKYH